MFFSKKALFLTVFATFFFAYTAYGQTLIANRIKAAVKRLSKEAVVAAQYTDKARHCVYYIMNHRLYRLDVISNEEQEVDFPNGYLKITGTYSAPRQDILFVIVDRGSLSANYAIDGQTLYAINSHTLRKKEVGSGFSIKKSTVKGEPCITIKKAYKCIDPTRNKWKARNHHYDLSGNIIYAGDDYNVRVEKKR